MKEMQARKVQFKLFVESPGEVDIDSIVPVFHRWIREKAFDELLIDVTDYAHVPNGPALLLVGHGSDYAMDFAEGRPGLLYSRKREAPEDARACVLDALRRALSAARKLEEETSLPKPLRFRGDELLFRLNDRLLAPNTAETFSSVEPLLRDVLGKLYLGVAFSLERIGTSRELFSVKATAPGAPGVGALLQRIT
jgi:hypothetical protein